MTYSDVSRSGVFTKISRKGYVFKTYEGDLNNGGFNDGNGTIMPNSIFKFSVHDQPAYKKLEELQGKLIVISYVDIYCFLVAICYTPCIFICVCALRHMAISYEQVIKNFFWQGETDYFVIDVKEIN
jgi:hypothetical protein